MKLEFYGATSGVTGSCHIIRSGGHQILLDCGLIQGSRQEEESNRAPFPFDPHKIDAVILSHAHIDHSGRLPLLIKRGFSGPVYTQNATLDLCRIMLMDSAGLAERDAVYENKRRERKGQDMVEPLYSRSDVQDTLLQMVGVQYRQKSEILPGITMRYQDAGHILGSCMVELWLTEGDITRKLVFSGDIGQYDTPILHDPALIEEADLVLMESTYGDRRHKDRQETIREIGEVIQNANHDKGNILVPSFAVGRSQEVLYLLAEHYAEWGMQDWQVYLDSPMAIEASQIYWDYPHLYDEDATNMRNSLHEMPHLKNLHLTASVEESQALNRVQAGAVIIAGSGMCTGGRIVHHLKHNISRHQCHVMIVGWQAYGTLGRRLVNGEEVVRIHGNNYRVNAKIHTIGGLSAHADQRDLLKWVRGFRNKPRILIIHGEQEAKNVFSEFLQAELGVSCHIPEMGDVINLLEMS